MSNLTTAAFLLNQLQMVFLKIQLEWDARDPDQYQWEQQIERASAFCHNIFNQVIAKVDQLQEGTDTMDKQIKKVQKDIKVGNKKKGAKDVKKLLKMDKKMDKKAAKCKVMKKPAKKR